MSPVRPSSDTRAELQELKAEYFYCVDNKLWDRLLTIFTSEAQFKGVGFSARGPEHFIEVTASLFEKIHSSHYGFQPLFSFLPDDDSLIRGRWSMQDFLTWDPQQASMPGVTEENAHSLHGFGYYDDLYKYEDDRWKLHSMRLIRTRVDIATGGVSVHTF